ncbi:hypothetical protein EDD18DRAFT_1363165 [Armillaria luteobubalina]|uniref:Uncharacterized protein n=1 Tax=Armillaria luteobubalina TaxID=153913 RepID=A0AA39UC68_9AGAR|nr:hypothetical protein EDD18DRAFT_1363165 [Armillaria luteobubalina]
MIAPSLSVYYVIVTTLKLFSHRRIYRSNAIKRIEKHPYSFPQQLHSPSSYKPKLKMFLRILALLPFVSLAISSIVVDNSFHKFCANIDTFAAEVVLSVAKAADSDIKDATNTCPTTVLSEGQGHVVLSKFEDLKPSFLKVCQCVIDSRKDVDKLHFTQAVPIIKLFKEDLNALMEKVLKCTPDGSRAGMDAADEEIIRALQKVADAYNAN